MSKTVDIKALADYAVSEGTQNTEDGRWETSYEELYNHFGVEIERGDDACKELAQALRQRKEVRDLTITEDGIDVSYDTLFCKNLTLEGVSPMLERHPAILAYAVEMSRLADRYAKQAVDSQLDGIGRIRYYDMNSGAFRDHIDEELLLDMILDHPEIEEIESDFEGYDFTIAEGYRPKEQPLRELDEDEVEVMCAKHVLWHNGEGGEQADFSNCLIRDADLRHKNLMNANFDGTRFVGVNLKDAYCEIDGGELFALGVHISPYEQGNIFNRDPMRPKKLLMHKREIMKLAGLVSRDGYTLVPLSLYFKGSHVKMGIGLCKGKKLYDKRDDAAKRDADRTIEQHMKNRF